MAIYDLFSKRQKEQRGEVPDVYVYNEIPRPLRVQLVHIIRDAFGKDLDYHHSASEMYKFIHDALCREYGIFRLDDRGSDYETDTLNFLLKTHEIEKVIDVIELSFRAIDKVIRDNYEYTSRTERQTSPDDAISEANDRFKENGVGYQYVSGQILRVDSQYAHAEIVKPTLNLLSSQKFKGANEEFLKAHEHYRNGRNKECLNECLKAIESTMKIICHEKGWVFNANDTSKKLIQICFTNNLIPAFIQNQFTSLISLMESGIPTVRNRLGGHGQGTTPKTVDDEITRYALNLTGSNIILLIEQSGIK